MPLNEALYNNLPAVILIPLIAALIGWVTNYIAVKMIFRPKKAVNFLGIKIQGLVPKRQKDLAATMGETIQRDLISHHDIARVLKSDEVRGEVFEFIDQQIESLLVEFLKKNPMLSMFLSGEILENIKNSLREHLQGSVPDLIDSLAGQMEERLDLKKVVEDKINSFDLTKLEEIVYRISSTELKTIEYLGGVLGFFVGLAQVAIMLLSL